MTICSYAFRRTVAFAAASLWVAAAMGACESGPPPREHCGSGADEDGDGVADCADSDCWLAGGGCLEVCDSEDDEDADELVACADPDCWVVGAGCVELCSGDGDEDADGATDCADDDCWVAGAGCAEICDSGDDEDADGQVACSDSDCWLSDGVCPELCSGGNDEDGDGDIDCSDADCDSAVECAPTFSVEIQPLLKLHCAACHSGDPVFGGLSFDSYDDILLPSYYCTNMTKGECALFRILEPTMPQDCLGCVPQEDIDLLQKWVDAGTPE